MAQTSQETLRGMYLAHERVVLPNGHDELDALGNVPESYRHHRRYVAPAEPLAVPGVILKWYELARQGVQIPTEIRGEARSLLRHELEAGKIDTGYGLGFVVLHFSDTMAYLIVGTWRNHQELWQALYVRSVSVGVGGTGGRPFERVRPGTDIPVACVWELAPIWHERDAWVRYLESARGNDAKRAYLNDSLTGLV